MNSNTKPFAIAIIILTALLLTALIFFCWMDYNRSINADHVFYPLTAQVVDLNREADTVTCVDGAGRMWAFCGVEDWQINDLASLLMDNNGTVKTIYDDIIIMAHYAGIFEG